MNCKRADWVGNGPGPFASRVASRAAWFGASMALCVGSRAPGVPNDLGPSPGALLRSDCVFSIEEFSGFGLIYFGGFGGTVGVTGAWPGEMGWQGDRIDIQFALPRVADDVLYYAFSMNITHRFSQEVGLSIQAGAALDVLVEFHQESIDSPRLLTALIPTFHFVEGDTNWIRIQGRGVDVGYGAPAGIKWDHWSLAAVRPASSTTVVADQLARLAVYITDAIHPSGLVRDSLPLSLSAAPFHPATPDAAAFAVQGLCALDHVGAIQNAGVLVERILSAYSGHVPGVVPDRSADGYWRHFMDIETGAYAGGGWETAYTTIGSALLVSSAQFARNHFPDNSLIASLADELARSVDFNAAIHPSLDGRVYLSMAPRGGGDDANFGLAAPWNEFMIVVSLALREPENSAALAVRDLWLEPGSAPTREYPDANGLSLLTDDPGRFAPAFWVQQMHFFNADFSTNIDFERFFTNQQMADQDYSTTVLGTTYRYGLTSGVVPGGYAADRIQDHHSVFAPEAVAAWGDLDTVFRFYGDQPLGCLPQYRYGLIRVSTTPPGWVPFDAGLVDHLYLLYGLVEGLSPLYFVQRQPGQVDDDDDGIADAFDNCPAQPNPTQADFDRDGEGDGCDGDGDGDGVPNEDDVCDFTPIGKQVNERGTVRGDLDADCDVDLLDYGILLRDFTGSD